MKRAFSFALIFLIFVLIYQFVIIFFEQSHEVEYKILSKDKEFEIEEEYRKHKKDDGYYITINQDKKEFYYYIENNYNKQKRIIKDIKFYEKDNYLCIHPVTKDKKELEIFCSDGKEVYSYDYVNKRVDISEFLVKLKQEDSYKTDNTNKVSDKEVHFYTNNFYSNEYLSLYQYKKVTVFNQGIFEDYSFSNQDVYKNELGVFIDNFFLVPITEYGKPTPKYLLVDSIKLQQEIIYFDNPLSNKLYNIGVIDNKLYVFDLTYKTEYEINPNGTYKVLGDVDKGFKKYVDGKWVDASVTDFTKDRIKFYETKKTIELNYKYDEIFETKNYYYTLVGNKIYKIYKKDLTKRVLLLELNQNYSNLQVEEGRIYYIVDNYLYRYDKYGVDILVENNEFKYNNTNIYHMYNKTEEE